MNTTSNQTITEALTRAVTLDLVEAIFSNPRQKDGVFKCKVRPIMIKNRLHFQIEEWKGSQIFHQNLEQAEAVSQLSASLKNQFRQAQITSLSEDTSILVSKKGTVTVKTKKRAQKAPSLPLTHNRSKKYILEEGRPVPFLIDLGVMTREGAIVRSRYDKYRQINRFLEFVEDILPKLDKNRELTILDFGCGKSYLTFALYYYLKCLKGYAIRIIGLDRKEDVIRRCNALARSYGYDSLQFLHGDIADYTGVSQVDMVVTLHACDTATDFALAKAVAWNAAVILSVPCCQHELNQQIKNEILEPALKYGIIRERMSALLTDALRAEHLEACGYRTQLLEFIDMEHTPKNILIRAVYQGTPASNDASLRTLESFLHADLTLKQLLERQEPPQKQD